MNCSATLLQRIGLGFELSAFLLLLPWLYSLMEQRLQLESRRIGMQHWLESHLPMPYEDEYGSKNISQARRRWVTSAFIVWIPLIFVFTLGKTWPAWFQLPLALISIASYFGLGIIWQPSKKSTITPKVESKTYTAWEIAFSLGLMAVLMVGLTVVITAPTISWWYKGIILLASLFLVRSILDYWYDPAIKQLRHGLRRLTKATLKSLIVLIDLVLRFIFGLAFAPYIVIGTVLSQALSVFARTILNLLGITAFFVGIAIEFWATFC